MLKKEQIRLGRMLIISAFTYVKVVDKLCKKDNSYGADEMLSMLGRSALGQNAEAQAELFVYKKHLSCYRKLSLLFIKLLPVKSAILTKNFCKNKKKIVTVAENTSFTFVKVAQNNAPVNKRDHNQHAFLNWL